MTVSNVTGLEELFDMEEVDSNIIAIENCQSNKVFTEEYLKEVRIAQEQSGCRENLEKQLTRDFNGLRKPYGRLLKLNNEYLNAIDVRQIFDTGTVLTNNDTGVDDFPNGLQIRDGVIVDDENVDKFVTILEDGGWKKHDQQLFLVLLPKYYWRVVEDEAGNLITKKYAVIDGNHRFVAIKIFGEKHIFAYLMELNNLKDAWEFGNAFANRESTASSPRTPKSMGRSLVMTTNQEDSDLRQALDLIVTTDPDEKEAERREILENYLKNVYKLKHGNKVNAVLHEFYADTTHDYSPDMKLYKKNQLKEYTSTCPYLQGENIVNIGSEEENIFYNEDTKIITFIYKTMGGNLPLLISKMSKIYETHPDISPRNYNILMVPSEQKNLSRADIKDWEKKSKEDYLKLVVLIEDFIKKSRDDFATPTFLRVPLSKQIDGDLLGNPIPIN
tara:strand:- start:207 stop:1538 length:1332 start_codon:yes stop_codon:yes gene_type:complete